jgi:membrane-associated phospholipid phosphatase
MATGLATTNLGVAQTLAPAPVAASEPAARFSPSFRGIFTETVQDFRRLPSLQTATVLSIGGIGSAIGHRADRSVTRVLSSSQGLDGFFGAGQTLGGASLQMAGAFATYTIGRASNRPRVARVGSELVRAQIVTQVTTVGLKMAVGRTRPDGTQYSFPSGHASTTFATATVLQRNLGWRVGIPAYGVATYVAASRIQAKRHYVSDVAFGAALGIVAGRTVTLGKGDARFALSPAAAPGGASVNFTWVGKR